MIDRDIRTAEDVLLRESPPAALDVNTLIEAFCPFGRMAILVAGSEARSALNPPTRYPGR